MLYQGAPIKWEAWLFEDDLNCGVPLVRIHNSLFKEIGASPNSWVKIKSNVNGKVIYRIARGCNDQIEGVYKDTMMVDYMGACDLGIYDLKNKQNVRERRTKPIIRYDSHNDEALEEMSAYQADWSVSKANFTDCIKANCQHPDRGYRVSMQVAFIGVGIGVLSLITSVIGFFL